MVVHLLAKDGLKPEDVSIIGVGSSSGAIAAMTSGQLDAMSNLDPAMTMLETIGRGQGHVADTRTAKGTEACSAAPTCRRPRSTRRSAS